MNTLKINRVEIENQEDDERPTLPIFSLPAFAEDEDETFPEFHTLPLFEGR